MAPPLTLRYHVLVRLRLWLTVAIAVLAVGAAFFFVWSTQRSSQTIVAVLPRADGVREGTAVSYRGLNVGFVQRLHIDKGRVIAELRIQRKDGRIRQDDTLRVKSVGIFGDVSLDFTPGDLSAPFLEPSDTLLVIVRGG